MSGTDYNAFAGDLSMGDGFRLEEHGEHHIVAWSDGSVDGSVVYIHLGDRRTEVIHAYRRCFRYPETRRCACGRRYEYCERECVWPADLETLFMNH